MKRLAGLFLLPLFLFSCEDDSYEKERIKSQKKEKEVVAKPTSTLSGVIKNAHGEKLILRLFDGKQVGKSREILLDSTGTFSFDFDKNVINNIQMSIGNEFIILPFDGQEAIPFVTATYPEMDMNYSVNNSVSIAALKKYQNSIASERRKMKGMAKRLHALPQDDAKNRQVIFDSLMTVRRYVEGIAREKIAENPGSPICQSLISDIYPISGLKDWNPDNLTSLQQVLKAYQEKYPDQGVTKTLAGDVNSIATQMEAQKKMEASFSKYDFKQEIKVGKPAPDIMMDDPMGNEIKLSSLKGKVVLIDFWASWCGPCRRANPHVVDIYQRYKDKGFTVYSVSLDNKKEEWIKAIEQDGLIWENHVSDLLGWNTPMTQLYKFKGIPFTVLIDKKGIIQEINQRDPLKLEQKLQSLL